LGQIFILARFLLNTEQLQKSTIMKKWIAEFFGTFWLVFGGCGSAIFAANFLNEGETVTSLGIGFVGVSLAFGLTVLTMAYAIGHISGAHLNPAVSIGLWIGKRFDGKELLPYIVSQILGAIAAAAVLYFIVQGKAGFDGVGGFAANGYGEHSPGGYNLGICCRVCAYLFLFALNSWVYLF